GGMGNDEVRLLDDDLLDLEAALVDAFGLDFPMSPTCTAYARDDTTNPLTPEPDADAGTTAALTDPPWATLAAVCGRMTLDADAGSTEGRIDPRWAGLAEKFGRMTEGGDDA